MIRILVVDDHAILRDGIRSILESQSDIIVVGEAGNGAEAVEFVEELLPDIVLMDISMPITNGLEATRLIKERFPQVKVLVLTQHDNREYIAPALVAGAVGYVLKRSGRREMLNAIRKVHEAGTYISNTSSGEGLVEHAHPNHNGETENHKLTNRERQVLQMVVAGKSNKEIALELEISPKTVSVHRTNIMTKLDVQNTVELIRYAANNPIISLPLSE